MDLTKLPLTDLSYKFEKKHNGHERIYLIKWQILRTKQKKYFTKTLLKSLNLSTKKSQAFPITQKENNCYKSKSRVLEQRELD